MEFMDVFLLMPDTNFWHNEMLSPMGIHENLHQKCLIFRAMCFTIYGSQKALFLRNLFHKTLPKISKCYASVSMHYRIIYGSLWGPHGHGIIDILDWDTLSEGIL